MAFRLKASNYVNNCPVSDKAYFTFAKRIMSVVFGPQCELMLQTLNKYLEGDRLTYAEQLDEHLKKTFEMLRFEIDKAIERSSRARAAARARKKNPNKHKNRAETAQLHKMPVTVNEETPSKPLEKPADANLLRVSRIKTDKAVIKTANTGLSIAGHTREEVAVITSPARTRRQRRSDAAKPRYKWRKIG